MMSTAKDFAVITVIVLVIAALAAMFAGFDESFDGAPRCAKSSAECTVQENTGFVGACYCKSQADSADHCCKVCGADGPTCVGWTYDKKHSLCTLKATITGQIANDNLTSGTVKSSPPPLAKPMVLPTIDPKALYTISDASGAFRLVYKEGAPAKDNVSMRQQCKGGEEQKNCQFRFVQRAGGPLYSIETADGENRLAMQGKIANGGLSDKNPVAFYNGLQEVCAGDGLAKECLFKVTVNGNATWKIEAGDCTGILSFWDLTSRWRPIYDNPKTRAQADDLPLFMRTTGTAGTCGQDCEFLLTEVGQAAPVSCRYTKTSQCGNDSIFIQNCQGQFLAVEQNQSSSPTWVAEPTSTSCFRLIDPPFGGRYPPSSFSLESVAFPEYFLRHSSTIMRLDREYRGQNDDFVFQFIPAMNGQPDSFSIRPVQQHVNQSCFFSQSSPLQFKSGVCDQADPEFANAASFNVGTSELKGQRLCQYTTTFSGCQKDSIYIQNCRGQYLLPVQGQWTPTWVKEASAACCFNLVQPPFGGEYPPQSFSIESVAFPSYFLRHSNFIIRLDRNYTGQNDDFVFQFVAGASGEPNTFSLRPSQPQWNNSCLMTSGNDLGFQSGLTCPQESLLANAKATFNLGTSKLTPVPPIRETTDRCSGECPSTLVAQNGICKIVTQTDGGLVIYNRSGKLVWASGTDGMGIPPYHWAAQSDGNIILYDSWNRPLWASNTAGQGTPPFTAILGLDCNFCLYDANGRFQWASWTQGQG